MNNEIIIIGGGASALMLASLLPKNSATIIESNAKIGAKILISGGGKCNITNTHMHTKYFLGDENFIAPALKAFSKNDLLVWLRKRNLVPVLRKKMQYFCPNTAKELVDVFHKEVKKQKIVLNEKVLHVTKRGEYFTLKTNKRTYTSKYLVVASGGLSFPKIGASSIGYDVATYFGHTLSSTAPALVGFTVQKEQFFFKELSGTSCNVSIEVAGKRHVGALLFTHKGVSGPAILDASLYWKKGQIEIDFLPDFNLETLKGNKKKLSLLLPLPKRMSKAFLEAFDIEDKPYMHYSKEEKDVLQTFKSYTFAPAGTFGFSKAEVTKGGIVTDEVDEKSMMSKKIPQLYFVGEVLDVTGRLGGYNFQWAFSSAYLCAEHLKKEKIRT